jgi:hypothetical protein
MPQFMTGESRTARALMRNPTGRAFDYDAFVYLGTDLAVASERAFSLAAGEERQIAFPVVMPAAPGTYPVHVGVFSEGRNIALYRATEDVAVARPPAFAWSGLSLQWEVHPNATDLRDPVISAVISNPSGVAARHIVTLWRGVIIGGSYPDQHQPGTDFGVPAIDLALGPGESYGYSRRIPEWLAVYNVTQYYYFWFRDEDGNRSPVIPLQYDDRVS